MKTTQGYLHIGGTTLLIFAMENQDTAVFRGGLRKEGSEPSVDVRTQGKDRHDRPHLNCSGLHLAEETFAQLVLNCFKVRTPCSEFHRWAGMSVLGVRLEVALEDVY